MGKPKKTGKDILDRALDAFRSIIDRIENKDIPIGPWIMAFLAIVFMRNFLEMLSSRRYNLFSGSPIEWDFFLYHSVLFYGVSFLGLALIIFLFTKEKMGKIMKSILFLSLFIFITPCADIVAGSIFNKSMIVDYETFQAFGSIQGFLKYWISFVFTGSYGLFF